MHPPIGLTEAIEGGDHDVIAIGTDTAKHDRNTGRLQGVEGGLLTVTEGGQVFKEVIAQSDNFGGGGEVEGGDQS